MPPEDEPDPLSEAYEQCAKAIRERDEARRDLLHVRNYVHALRLARDQARKISGDIALERDAAIVMLLDECWQISDHDPGGFSEREEWYAFEGTKYDDAEEASEAIRAAVRKAAGLGDA